VAGFAVFVRNTNRLAPWVEFWTLPTSAASSLCGGVTDKRDELLAAAAKALPTEVKRALREDAHVWSVAAADARYQAIAGTPPAAPAR